MSESKPPVLHLERVFAAPRALVFDYFTVPALICEWWGPGGTTTEAVELDLRVGGFCRWDMRTADGNLTHLFGVFQEIIVPERLVMTHRWAGMEAETRVTLEFIDLGERTLLRLTHDGISGETLLPLYRDGWSNTLGRLDAALAQVAKGRKP
jgi:uncharacterized protein YndB with AHSA1/START domain